MTCRRAFSRRIAGAAAAAALALTAVAPANAAITEAQVKAAYLFRLVSFVRWPPSAFADGSAPLRICVMGRSDISAILELLARGQQADGRALATETIDGPAAASRCQIVFMGAASGGTAAVLAQLSRLPILVVTDRSAGLRGGIIEFVSVGGNIRLMIHREAAEARQITLSSKLLGVAQAVER